MAKKDLSRRDFLRLGGVAAASAALAGCATEPAEPQVVYETVEVVKEVAGEQVTVIETVEVVQEVEVEVEKEVMVGSKEIRYLTQTWNWEKLNMANATDHYNQELRAAGVEHQIVVDPTPDGWETKVTQMVQDNELLWNGMMRDTTLGGVTQKQKLGILQPWDEYIAASSAAVAGSFFGEILPGVREALTIDGKLYGLPWDGETYCRVYNKMIWDTIGETPAETWDEFEAQLEAIVAANPDKAALCLRHHDGHPDQQMFMQLWTDQPFIDT